MDELGQALWRADFCQEPPSCPASPRRPWAASSDESRSVGTQTDLLAARAAGDDTFRCERVRRQVSWRRGSVGGEGLVRRVRTDGERREGRQAGIRW